MTAAITDKFTSATNSSRPAATTLVSPHANGETTISVSALTGWPTDTAVHFIIYTTDTSGNKIAGSQTDWKGVVSGTTITNLQLKAGTDSGYSIGAIVECSPTAYWAKDLADGLQVAHGQDGVHKAGLVLPTPKITTSLNDSAGNEVIRTPATGSAVNDVTVTNAATGTAPKISASGDDTNVSLDLQGKGTGNVRINGTKIFAGYDYVVSGCQWTADAPASTRNASMSSGVVVIGGNPLTVAAVTARSFTASKDVYVDLKDNGDGTAVPVYYDNTTNAASPSFATTTGTMRLAIVVVGATNIAANTSINQGSLTSLLPVVSSEYLRGCDTLGNPIHNTNPSQLTFGRVGVASPTPSSEADVAGCTVTFTLAEARKVYIDLYTHVQINAGADRNCRWRLYVDGVNVIDLYSRDNPGAAETHWDAARPYDTYLAAGSHTVKVRSLASGAGVVAQDGGFRMRIE